MGWRGRWEGGSGWGTHVNPWLIHVNVWQKPLQYCKVISLQLIKIKEKKYWSVWPFLLPGDLPHPGMVFCIAGRFFTTEPLRKYVHS